MMCQMPTIFSKPTVLYLYGSLNGDPFVMASVSLGLPINYFALSSAFGILGKNGKVSDSTTSWRLDCVVFGGIAAWVVVAFVIGAIRCKEQKANVATSIVGFTACATCMIDCRENFNAITIFLLVRKFVWRCMHNSVAFVTTCLDVMSTPAIY